MVCLAKEAFSRSDQEKLPAYWSIETETAQGLSRSAFIREPSPTTSDLQERVL